MAQNFAGFVATTWVPHFNLPSNQPTKYYGDLWCKFHSLNPTLFYVFVCFCCYLDPCSCSIQQFFPEERHYLTCINIFLLPQCPGSAPKANSPAQMVAALPAGGSATVIMTAPTGQTRFGNVRFASDFMYLGMKSSLLYL